MKKSILTIAILFTAGFMSNETQARTFRIMGAASMSDGDDDVTTITCKGSDGPCVDIISRAGKITFIVYCTPSGPGRTEFDYGAHSTVNGYTVDALPEGYVSPNGVYVIENVN